MADEATIQTCDPEGSRMVVFSVNEDKTKSLPGRHEFKNYLRLSRDLLEDLRKFSDELSTNAASANPKPRIMRKPLRHRVLTVEQRCLQLMSRLFHEQDLSTVPAFRNRGSKKARKDSVDIQPEVKVEEPAATQA